MFSKAIFKSNWKRFWIIPVVTTIMLFLAVTFQMIMELEELKEDKKGSYYINDVIPEYKAIEEAEEDIIIVTNSISPGIVNNIENVTSTEVVSIPTIDSQIKIDINEERYFTRILYSFINIAIIFIVPVLISILLFSYMNEEKSSSFIHGLPISKKRLYSTNIITGITMYLIPYVINMIILLALNLGEMGDYLQTIQLWKWFGINILYNTIFFSFSSMIGMLSASKISHGILTYILMYAPIGMIAILSQILEEIIYGFNAFSSQIEEIAIKIPFIKVIEIFNDMRYYYANINTQANLEIKTIISYIIVAIIMILVGYFLYKKRKLEITKEFIAFKLIQSVIKYAATFCVNLLSYMYFYAIFDESKIISIASSMIITLIAYFIIEMILKKTYKVLKGIKGFIIYAIIIIVLYMIAINGALGFEIRIPKIEDVKEVVIVKNNEKITFDEKENIKTIIDLHQKIVTERKQGYSDYVVEYTLDNGRKLNRKYSTYTDNYENEFKKLYASDEYIEESTKVLQDINNIKEIDISINYRTQNYKYNYKNIEIEEKDKQNFINLLLKDIKDRKATCQSIYNISTIKIENEENMQITSINVRIELEDNKYKTINYIDMQDIKIAEYID